MLSLYPFLYDKPMEKVAVRIRVWIQQFVIACYRLMLPSDFVIHNRKVAKNTPSFALYVYILNAYSRLISNGRRHGTSFLIESQNFRLRRMLRKASRISWWNGYFKENNINIKRILTVEDLKSIPPINRQLVYRVPIKELCAQSRLFTDDIQINKTSGSTTGTPFAVAFPRYISTLDVCAHYIQLFKDYGFPFSAKTRENFLFYFNLFGGVKRLTTTPEQFAESLAIDTTDDSEAKIACTMEQIGSAHHIIFFTHPTELPLFIKKLELLPRKPSAHLCLVIGQVPDKEVLAFAEESLKCPVVSVYSFREQMITASSCIENRELHHIHSERVVVEILDDDGRSVPYGTYGNVTVTGLDNYLMPLIRYQPGDIGRLHSPTNCKCLNKTPLLEINGRAVDFFTFADGSRKSFKRFMSFFLRKPFFDTIQRVQVEQKNHRLIQVHFERKCPTPINLTKLLQQRISESNFFPPDTVVKVEEVEHINTALSKFKPFIPMKKMLNS